MPIPRKMPPLAEEVLKTLRQQRIRFNIVTQVDYRWEVHFESTRLDGTSHVHFVCEFDSFGNITDEGPYYREKRWRDRGVILNADGEVVYDENRRKPRKVRSDK